MGGVVCLIEICDLVYRSLTFGLTFSLHMQKINLKKSIHEQYCVQTQEKAAFDPSATTNLLDSLLLLLLFYVNEVCVFVFSTRSCRHNITPSLFPSLLHFKEIRVVFVVLWRSWYIYLYMKHRPAVSHRLLCDMPIDHCTNSAMAWSDHDHIFCGVSVRSYVYEFSLYDYALKD